MVKTKRSRTSANVSAGPSIVTVGGQKGGIGKTTVAVSLAVEWHRRGRRVLLVDTDPQGSARTWGDVAIERKHDAPSLVAMRGQFHLPGQLPAVAANYDVVVIDTPPRLATELRSALMVASQVVLPCGPSGLDAWALAETLELIQKAKALRPTLTAAMAVNRKKVGTVLGAEARAMLATTNLPVLATELAERVAYQESITDGLGPTTYEPEGVAAAEVRALVDELEALR